VVHTVDCVLKN